MNQNNLWGFLANEMEMKKFENHWLTLIVIVVLYKY